MADASDFGDGEEPLDESPLDPASLEGTIPPAPDFVPANGPAPDFVPAAPSEAPDFVPAAAPAESPLDARAKKYKAEQEIGVLPTVGKYLSELPAAGLSALGALPGIGADAARGVGMAVTDPGQAAANLVASAKAQVPAYAETLNKAVRFLKSHTVGYTDEELRKKASEDINFEAEKNAALAKAPDPVAAEKSMMITDPVNLGLMATGQIEGLGGAATAADAAKIGTFRKVAGTVLGKLGPKAEEAAAAGKELSEAAKVKMEGVLGPGGHGLAHKALEGLGIGIGAAHAGPLGAAAGAAIAQLPVVMDLAKASQAASRALLDGESSVRFFEAIANDPKLPPSIPKTLASWLDKSGAGSVLESTARGIGTGTHAAAMFSAFDILASGGDPEEAAQRTAGVFGFAFGGHMLGEPFRGGTKANIALKQANDVAAFLRAKPDAAGALEDYMKTPGGTRDVTAIAQFAKQNPQYQWTFSDRGKEGVPGSFGTPDGVPTIDLNLSNEGKWANYIAGHEMIHGMAAEGLRPQFLQHTIGVPEANQFGTLVTGKNADGSPILDPDFAKYREKYITDITKQLRAEPATLSDGSPNKKKLDDLQIAQIEASHRADYGKMAEEYIADTVGHLIGGFTNKGELNYTNIRRDPLYRKIGRVLGVKPTAEKSAYGPIDNAIRNIVENHIRSGKSLDTTKEYEPSGTAREVNVEDLAKTNPAAAEKLMGGSNQLEFSRDETGAIKAAAVIRTKRAAEQQAMDQAKVLLGALKGRTPKSAEELQWRKRVDADGKVTNELTGTTIPDDVMNALIKSNKFNPTQISNLKRLMLGVGVSTGTPYEVWYHKATKGSGKYVTAAVDQHTIVPFEMQVSAAEKGKGHNVLFRVLDVSQVQKNFAEAVKNRENVPVKSLGEAMTLLETYLNNHKRGYRGTGDEARPGEQPSQEAAGPLTKTQADFINELLGVSTKETAGANPLRAALVDAGDSTSKSAIKSFRLDRMNELETSSGDQKFPTNYNAIKRNFSRQIEGTKREPIPNEDTRKVAEGYMKARGDVRPMYTGHAPVDETYAKKVADYFDAAQHSPQDPEVQGAYKALRDETMAQWDAMQKAGVKAEPWTKEGQPYKNSREMRADVRDNKHLWYFPTDAGYGKGEVPDANTHPMLEKIGTDSRGRPLLVNDVFRAVHDYFGHTKEGYEFGPRGELNAYLAHKSMYSPEAAGALASETLAQNSWVNFGKHLRDEKGNIPQKGEKGYLSQTEKPYADQKAMVVPAELQNPPERAVFKDEKLQGKKHEMPNTATPMILQPVLRSIRKGDAVAKLNAMTGTWMVFGQKDGGPYIFESEKSAAKMVLKIDHYNRTGERKNFSNKDVDIEWAKKEVPIPPGINSMSDPKFSRQLPANTYSKLEKVIDVPKEGVPPQELYSRSMQHSPSEPLEHAAGDGPLRILHASAQTGLKAVDPKHFGKGMATPTDRRGGDKSYFFVEGSGQGGDKFWLKGQKLYGATVDKAGLYDGNKDPLGYFGEINREAADDKLIDAGYKGLIKKTGDGREVVAMFKPVKVTPAGEAGKGKIAAPDVKFASQFRAAAVRIGDKVFEANTHWDALLDAVVGGKIGGQDPGDVLNALEQSGNTGFVTKNGQFLNRKDAYDLAEKTGEIEGGGMRMLDSADIQFARQNEEPNIYDDAEVEKRNGFWKIIASDDNPIGGAYGSQALAEKELARLQTRAKAGVEIPSVANLQTDTPEFKKWFGSSKAVDEKGQPLRVYHGTTRDFEAFDKTKGGLTTGAPSARGAMFFSADPEVANSYTELGAGRTADEIRDDMESAEKKAQKTDKRSDWQTHHKLQVQYEKAAASGSLGNSATGRTQEGGNVVPAFLRLENPLVHDFSGEEYQEGAYNALLRQARREGNDGVIFKNTQDSANDPGNFSDVYAVFDPRQIKSAVGNRGTFYSTDPRLTFARQNDAEYLKAAHAGDTETAQKMVDEAAKKAGYAVKGYHSTPYQFTKFDRNKVGFDDPDTNIKGFHFLSVPEANAGGPYTSGDEARGERGPTKTISAYLNLGKTIGRREAQQLVHRQMREADEKAPWANRAPELTITVEEMKKFNKEILDGASFPVGYDSVEFIKPWNLTPEKEAQFAKTGEVHEGNYVLVNSKDRGVEMFREADQAGGREHITGYETLKDAYDLHSEAHYIVRDSEQIKSADPITRDDKGNIIPLSERFNSKNNDIRYARAMPKAWSDVSQHLTPDEMEKTNRKGAEGVIAAFRKFDKMGDELETAAVAGEAKKGWYKDATQSLQDLFGSDTRQFVHFLAALSPRQSVEANLSQATRLWAKWKEAGSPSEETAIHTLFNVDRSKRTYGDFEMESRAIAAMETLQKGDFSYTEGNRPKVSNFAKNLLGDVEGVTNDTWIAAFFGVDGRELGVKSTYKGMAAVTRKVAKKLGWTPAEVQETVWSFVKTLHEQGPTSEKTGKSWHQIARELTDVDIAKTPDFATLLLHDPAVRQDLTRLGIDHAAYARGRGEPKIVEPKTVAERTGTGREVVLERTTKRLERASRRARGLPALTEPEQPF